jgi:hypothetical protein
VIAASYSKALGFYQQHNIAQIELDGSILYTDKEWIVSDRVKNARFDIDMLLPLFSMLTTFTILLCIIIIQLLEYYLK